MRILPTRGNKLSHGDAARTSSSLAANLHLIGGGYWAIGTANCNSTLSVDISPWRHIRLIFRYSSVAPLPVPWINNNHHGHPCLASIHPTNEPPAATEPVQRCKMARKSSTTHQNRQPDGPTALWISWTIHH